MGQSLFGRRYDPLTYDYVFAGAGCAGRILLVEMLETGLLDGKRVLVVDPLWGEERNKTWCFWEEVPERYGAMVEAEWNAIALVNAHERSRKELKGSYKMIRSEEFYARMDEVIAAAEGVQVRREKVVRLTSMPKACVVELGDGMVYRAKRVFDNRPLKWRGKAYNHLERGVLQHFKGQWIETESAVFERDCATFMDFRFPQEKGTHFIYLLPLDERRALVEYTVFSEGPLDEYVYDQRIHRYLRDTLKVGNYAVTDVESGIIPMIPNFRIGQSRRNLIPIGARAGFQKASTGYAFTRLVRMAQGIVDQLLTEEVVNIERLLPKRRFQFYDRLFLRILKEQPERGAEILFKLFSQNRVNTVLQFLSDESSLWQEGNLFLKLPWKYFIKSLYRDLFNKPSSANFSVRSKPRSIYGLNKKENVI